MGRVSKMLKIAYMAATTLAVIASFSTATYAWFTANSVVQTDKVTGHVAAENIELQISSAGGNAFKPSAEAGITQINKADLILPVSTADLTSFVTNSTMVEGKAMSFYPVENEKDYYHGVVYLRAVGENIPTGTRMALYLDEAENNGGILVQNNTGENGLASTALNAARLGLRLEGSAPVILKCSNASNAADKREMNTRLNGLDIQEGMVLKSSNGNVTAVADPAVLYTDYCMDDEGNTLAKHPLAVLDFDKVYAMDVYIYLEGCDPDCTDSIQLNRFDVHLGLYGVLTEEGAR